MVLLVASSRCDNKEEAATDQAATSAAPQPSAPLVPSAQEQPGQPEPVAKTPEPVDAGPPPPYAGPFLVVTDSSAGIYSNTEIERRSKIGYARRGDREPVLAESIKKSNCSSGWYQVVGGGYICANNGTTDLESSKAKLTSSPPNLDDILPYRYARNSVNGTPLYKSVPTPEQISRAEKSLTKPKKSEDKPAQKTLPETPPPEAIPEKKPGTDPEDVDGGPEKSWWEQDDADKRLHKLKLTDLAADRDEVIAQRMVKGFYVAIDKIFKWNNRTWYKTTKGLIAPADRFWVTDASDFKGVELKGDVKLPIGWVYGWSKERPKYEINPETKALKPTGSVKHFESVALTGDELTIRNKRYVALSDGSWMRKDDVRIPEPGAPPAGIGPDERWVDVDLSSQTLVAFVGTTPVYATLISSGKESKIKEKDHSTPVGDYRIREKHIATTMDGDGTVAGDLPYSIEDVPFVMYFHKAYALHGAFWHRNYGVRMSHGCVNLAPLDAKYLFFFTGPRFPQGWHGAWATDENPGSRVLVHD
jgi:hypothetical protein